MLKHIAMRSHDDCGVCDEARLVNRTLAGLERLRELHRLNDLTFSLSTQLWHDLSAALANASIKY